MERFRDKVVLITGASTGIGKASAIRYAAEGAKLILADISEEKGKATLEEVIKKSKESLFIHCDVTDATSVKEMIKQSISKFGRIDVAINNAGIGGASAHTADYPEDEWQKVINVNLTGVYLCMKYELQEMVKAKKGNIVNMASILGKVGFMGSAAYVAAKHGVVGLTETAALEYAPQGIRINALCPGFIYTPMLENAGLAEDDKLHQAIANMHAMKRMGKPEEVADALLWISSEEATFVTGHSLAVDGGFLAQ
ncbi:SDR family oxidoreductase [Rhodocytophaga aerolata]|uniref:SDR family oxidoreductase n=1 Tax=Rhodocytophaga aerolata TaxID=455078 RepID=A0ABT8QZT2_9BACT|nr:SDR family oxidoreductase [Rhodocytophaga aerolata]MDO1445351.1 SDR family oxidoreductase [Rhodocytophaga aerolata]